ncbi:T-cell surface glycoprotein CD4-like [Pyxicephalus adspersus]|uniref:T-cell surface glycoprotein CD4-like n=1 Tax=Pyxicephalus adspersus TaxID=30357 RepID=UPI003B599298
MEKLYSLFIFFLYFYKCVSLEPGMRILAEVGKKTNLPCDNTQGDIMWLKNGAFLFRFQRGKRFQSHSIDVSRFIPDQSTNAMELDKVQLKDSGTYTCQKDKKTVYTVTLFVFEVSGIPSFNLISSEDLVLKVTFSPEQVPALQVYWMKGDKKIGKDTSVELKNVNLDHSGYYSCHIKIEGADEVKSSKEIKVRGFAPLAIEYLQESKPVILPWRFNFKVRSTQNTNDAKVKGGKITYPSQVVKQLDVTQDTVRWPEERDIKTEDMQNLDIHLSNPKIGDYRMEIDLEMGGRTKKLWGNVCLAGLTVSSFSKQDVSTESSVTLLCQINCLDKNGKLCWQNMNIKHEKCGSPGQINLTEEVNVLPETSGIWTCSVVVNQKTIVSANETLEIKNGFLDLSGYKFWVLIGAGALVLLIIVMIIVIMVARSRRLRRAQKRAWLSQNLNQQKRCKCKGFPPQRLKENI